METEIHSQTHLSLFIQTETKPFVDTSAGQHLTHNPSAHGTRPAAFNPQAQEGDLSFPKKAQEVPLSSPLSTPPATNLLLFHSFDPQKGGVPPRPAPGDHKATI